MKYEKYTYKYVKNFIEINSNCKLLSNEYNGAKIKLKLLCECGNEFEVAFGNFKINHGRQCKECGNKNKRIKQSFSYEYVRDYIKNNSNSQLIDKTYINCEEKILLKCKCNNEYKTSFKLFKKGNNRQCKECIDNRRSELQNFDYNYIKNFIENNSNCKLLSTIYKNCFNKLELLCNCGEKFTISFHDFTNGNKKKCNKCSRKESSKKQMLKYEDIKNYVEGKGHYLVDDKYLGKYKKLTIKDNEGFLYYCSFSNFKKNKQPGIVYPSNIYSIENIELWLKINNKTIKIKNQKYQRHNKKLIWECCNTGCNKIFESTWNNIQQGTECPYCNTSKGEKRIKKFLETNNITYKIQFKFDDCKDSRKLPFDFAIFNSKDKLQFLLEYDGEQHFKPIKYGKEQYLADNKFKKNQLHDNIKNYYCKNNNIELLRIPYYEFDNIENIINNYLNKFYELGGI